MPLRLLVALSIFCICGISAFWGWQVARFSEAVAHNDDVRSWIGFPGLTGPAMEASLQDTSQPVKDSLAVKSTKLAALIAAHPMSSQAWLSLAVNQLASGRPVSEVDSSLTMSRLTGPNEGRLMWQRGLFALLRWNELSSDAQRRAIANLSTAIHAGVIDGQAAKLAATILLQKPPDTRAAIAVALAAAGLSPADMAGLGLLGASR